MKNPPTNPEAPTWLRLIHPLRRSYMDRGSHPQILRKTQRLNPHLTAPLTATLTWTLDIQPARDAEQDHKVAGASSSRCQSKSLQKWREHLAPAGELEAPPTIPNPSVLSVSSAVENSPNFDFRLYHAALPKCLHFDFRLSTLPKTNDWQSQASELISRASCFSAAWYCLRKQADHTGARAKTDW